MRLLVILFVWIGLASSAQAEDIPGFPKEAFGKIVLSSKQYSSGKLEATIGDYKNEPISKYGIGSPFAKLGRPVGRLDVLTNTRMFPCTGFLISPKHVMTNYHCVPGLLQMPDVQKSGAKKIIAINLVLGYVQEGVTDRAKTYSVSPKPVEANEKLDYAILEIKGEPSKIFGVVKLAARRVQDNYPHWIIGHPLGEAQKISREGCMTARPALSVNRLRHRCDTLPGNSGSPVIDSFTHKAVAIHHAGSRRNSINYAVPFSEIAKQSKLLSKLLKLPVTKRQFASEDEARNAWQAIKDLTSPSVFETYIKRYPNFFYAEFAKARLKDLRAKPKPRSVASLAVPQVGNFVAPNSPKQLAEVLQRELKRVGCYSGKIDGDWGPGSKRAMSAYNIHAKVAYPTEAASPQAVGALKKVFARICPASPKSIQTKSKIRKLSTKKSKRSRSSSQSGCVPYSRCIRLCRLKGVVSNCARRCSNGIPLPRGPVCGY